MKLIVGLGNPGEKYRKTRHNLGFMVIEKFFKDFEPERNTVWENSSKFKSDLAQIEWKPKHGKLEKVILAKPKTYMNNSGMAVRLILDFYKIEPLDIWIVHDDIDLPLGSMKIRFGGASAGHHGVDSIIENLNTDKFWRFRMGIGQTRTKMIMGNHMIKNTEDYVLSDFIGQERGKVKDLVKRGASAIEVGLEKGLETAMNRFNTK
ncbi:aminoacyl-tRNA hydrolase [Candidatus Roizmanbacteria bacterium]|nr:aminoacyl-tRNA hydrolase [Candidatus Roizmanbacteria bacterium]